MKIIGKKTFLKVIDFWINIILSAFFYSDKIFQMPEMLELLSSFKTTR